MVDSLGARSATWRKRVPIEEAVAVMRTAFAADSHVFADFPVTPQGGHVLWFGVDCYGEGYERKHPSGPLRASPFDRRDVLSERLDIALGGGSSSVEVESAILAIQAQQDIEYLLMRLCAPDALSRVTTGACMEVGGWHAPIETCATYHADAALVARDLAVSWVHLHDGDRVERAAGLPLSTLRARVEAAPHGDRIAVAGSVELLHKHFRLQRAAAEQARQAHVETAPRGARFAIAGDDELTREQVLAALSMPQFTLLEALEASALPDDDWRAVEPLALETIEATRQGAPTYEVARTAGKHTRFIERHAPYHVRRLPNGGVLLATHPYRTLWPLWADALLLLAIRS